MKKKIKAGDEVVVLAGNERGERAKVLQVFPQRSRVLLEGLNKRKHHEKAKSDQEPGGITERETPMHISNVMSAARYDKKIAAKSGK